jgi:hypothetical protein
VLLPRPELSPSTPRAREQVQAPARARRPAASAAAHGARAAKSKPRSPPQRAPATRREPTLYPSPVLMTPLLFAYIPALQRQECLGRRAKTRGASFPLTDVDTSTRDCRPLQPSALDPAGETHIATARRSTCATLQTHLRWHLACIHEGSSSASYQSCRGSRVHATLAAGTSRPFPSVDAREGRQGGLPIIFAEPAVRPARHPHGRSAPQSWDRNRKD